MKILLQVLFVSVLVVTSTSSASAPMCSEVFATSPTPKYFSKAGLLMFQSPSLRKHMAYDFKTGKTNRVWVLIHGLGDDMSKMQKIAALAETEGFGILRVDLFGHGESLNKYIATNKSLDKESFYYKDNIVALRELLQHLGINDVVIVGHSYGGGISYGLAADLANHQGRKRIKVHSVHMLAPYVQRIDKFLQNYYQSPEFILGQTARAMETMGAKSSLVITIMEPLFRLSWNMSLGIRYFQDYLTHSLKITQWKDLTLDPFVERFMSRSYRKYFVALTRKKEKALTPQENEDIDRQVTAAIQVTKGIRDFDLLDTTSEITSFGAPIQVIGGSKDSLVLPGQLYEFNERLNSSKIPHRLDFMEGEQAHHLFPWLMAEETYRQIRAFQEAPPTMAPEDANNTD